jgi:hypothetical protein
VAPGQIGDRRNSTTLRASAEPGGDWIPGAYHHGCRGTQDTRRALRRLRWPKGLDDLPVGSARRHADVQPHPLDGGAFIMRCLGSLDRNDVRSESPRPRPAIKRPPENESLLSTQALANPILNEATQEGWRRAMAKFIGAGHRSVWRQRLR